MTKSRSCIALVAHDNKKTELVEWVKQHRDTLSNYALCATGTTGLIVEKEVASPFKSSRADRWVAINKSAPGLPKGRLISSFSFGTRWRRTRMTLMSRRCCGLPWFGMFRLRAITLRLIS